MRKTLIALAATTGLLSLGSVGASAVTLGATVPTAQPSHAAIQQADWGCGPNCEYLAPPPLGRTPPLLAPRALPLLRLQLRLSHLLPLI